MRIQSLDPAAVARVSEHYGVGLSDAYLTSFSPRVHGLLPPGSWSSAVPALDHDLSHQDYVAALGQGTGPRARRGRDRGVRAREL